MKCIDREGAKEESADRDSNIITITCKLRL